MRSQRLKGLAVIGSLLLLGCSTPTPIYTVERVPLTVPDGANPSDLHDPILNALDFWGWAVEEQDEAKITARRESADGAHFLVVLLEYDSENLSIRHMSSSPSLEVDPVNGTAHETYNMWIQQLEFGTRAAALFATAYRRVSEIQYPPELLRENLVGHVFDRSYALGREQRAFTGEEMIRIKDYYVLYSEVGNAVVVGNWSISGTLVGAARQVSIEAKNGEAFPLLGSYRDRGRIMYLVKIPHAESRDLILSVDDTGSIVSEHFIATTNVAGNLKGSGVDLYRLEPHPEDTRRLFRLEGEAVEVDRGSGYTNYALIYHGTTGQQINIGYREFSRDDMARVAFYQDLVYRVGEPSIRFRGLQMKVRKATNEEIVFTVVGDEHVEQGPQ